MKHLWVLSLDVIYSIALGVLGGVFLKASYTLVHSKWPKSYTYSFVSYKLTRVNLVVLASFYFFPPYFTCLIVYKIASRENLIACLVLITCVTYFICTTFRQAIIEDLHSDSSRKFINVIFDLSKVFTSILAAVLAYLSSRLFWIVPEPKDFINTIWTAIFATVFFFSAGQWSSGSGKDSEPLLYRLSNTVDMDQKVKVWRCIKKDVGEKSWNYLFAAADNFGIYTPLLLGIVGVEVIERPRWFRRFERVFGYFNFGLHEFTYGITQEHSKRPISDRHAIDLTCRWLKKENLTDERMCMLFQNVDTHFKASHTEELVAIMNKRNPDSLYGENVIEVACSCVDNYTTLRHIG